MTTLPVASSHERDDRDPQGHPLIRVKPSMSVSTISGLISSSIEEDEVIVLRAIGAGAVNQGLKGVIQARQQLSGKGYDLVIRPGMQTVEGHDGTDVTAMVMRLHII